MSSPQNDAVADASPVETASLESLRALLVRSLRGRNACAYLFGSFVTGGRHRASDIDVTIDAGEALPAVELALLREAIEESASPYRVDVVDLASVEPSLRESVLRTGRLWIERASA